jgi:uncharacterized protein with ParB-like and HNH nuclease domain
MSRKPVELSVRDLFEKRSYVIPLYQRNYAWEEAQVVQLIQDIWDNVTDTKKHNYYIGTLVVHRRNDEAVPIFETIDGQQRLTTLNILLSVLKREYRMAIEPGHDQRLKFDSRKISSQTLKLLSEEGRRHGKDKVNSLMEQAYLDMDKKLGQLLKEKKVTISNFTDYLLRYVKILQVEVPPKTNLNHYFEIMNNRGEQLEKHEILKATLLSHFKDDTVTTTAISLIWEASSNMDKYIELGFIKKNRDKLISDGKLLAKDLDTAAQILNVQEGGSSGIQQVNFLDFLQKDDIKIKAADPNDNSPENARFTTIISFPNFLLHVLRVYTGKDIMLDDKNLIRTFADEIKLQGIRAAEFVKDFAFALLRCRLLYDRFIIKREITQNGDSWSMKTVRKYESSFKFTNTFIDENKNKQVVMLISMFHVSFPQVIYKHWLTGALNFLYHQTGEIDANKYIKYLEQLSDAFYYDRIREAEVGYYEMIFVNNSSPIYDDVDEAYLHDGTKVQNFVFNRLDYLIWKSIVVKNESRFNIENVSRFEFSSRSSVEHFFPQTPKAAIDKKALETGIVDHFGNLCLISRSKNSELSNYSPVAKTEHYNKLSIVESLKQQLMMKESRTWGQISILKHDRIMIDFLKN